MGLGWRYKAGRMGRERVWLLIGAGEVGGVDLLLAVVSASVLVSLVDEEAVEFLELAVAEDVVE